MATYKVIQDIEAEDKLLGPLTLRQFIYALIVALMGFIAFRLSLTAWYTALPFIPPMLLFAVLAAPFGHDQPSEVWLLAKIRFALKPRKRVWDQSGISHLVTITAPKRIEKHYTDGLSQKEVHSRLRALADTIDSRGWAVKNVNVNLFSQPGLGPQYDTSDRLVSPSALPQEVPTIDVLASDDIMDARNNPVAQQLDQMMTASASAHRQQALEQMNNARGGPAGTAQSQTQTNDYWFMNQPDPAQLPGPGYAAFGTQIVAPGSDVPQAPVAQPSNQISSDEQALLQQIHDEQSQQSHVPQINYGHLKVINPLGQQPPVNTPSATPTSIAPPNILPTPMTHAPEPVILELASNDDLNVATLAREADRAQKKQPPADEVVVSLR